MQRFSQYCVVAIAMIYFGTASPQNGMALRTYGGCDVVDPSKPPQFVSYERTEPVSNRQRGARENRVWLRLHNNTSCTIIIATDGVKLSKLPGGTATFDLQDGTVIGVNYEVQDSRREKGPKPVHGGDEVIISRLPSSRSIIFSVPYIYFKQRLDIVVPFKYEWERSSSPRVGPVYHRVSFRSEDLPQQVTPK